MRVTIIGAGRMAHGIGTRAIAGGNDVTFMDRTPEKAASLADQLRECAVNAQVKAAPWLSTPEDETVILALPYRASLELAGNWAQALEGKVIVDISNPLNATYDGLATSPGTSAAEEIARAAPQTARVVKAFNTTFAATLLPGAVDSQKLDVFIAGDDSEAKGLVSRLVETGGMRPIDAGPLRHARYLEAMGFIHIVEQNRLGTQFKSALKLLS